MDTSSEREKAIALLQKYKAGLCTPEEIARIRQWYDSFDDLSSGQNIADARMAADEAAHKTLIKLFGENKEEQTRDKKGGIVYTLLRIAACLIVGCTLYFMAGKFKKTQPSEITYSKYSTRKGERREIRLSDGSIIVLNAASTIQIASDFGIEKRNVLLQGEAFFEVSKDKTRPFIIKTGKIQTRVVGTSFNINAYADEKSVSVAVSTGKVQVEKEDVKGKTLIGRDLTHNHMLVYDIKKDTYRQMLTDADLLSAWRTNKLVFNNASMAKIARTLERSYNIPVVLTGKPYKQGLYTVTFDNYPLDKLLPLLANLTGITYEFKMEQLIINVQHCK
ncbi:FecR domain-containing protein [Mucilaginibacter sabulilitoris]|uniref:FecR domain-containing protein n=1 Tax=Mucilaginibacter sabulilitoris TaxID=1173583 RepID=A0ABZ0TW03_9SPHI|nr:FecR domain-containing protein [Mucilaginibacter sabulilitoris]WPU97089.1 FecR domain-containing protein [Mucilaginibacter sabulilitoris]